MLEIFCIVVWRMFKPSNDSLLLPHPPKELAWNNLLQNPSHTLQGRLGFQVSNLLYLEKRTPIINVKFYRKANNFSLSDGISGTWYHL
jgi:hypothetical protein